MTGKSPMDEIRLIATDLDGTLIGEKPEFGLYNAFREQLMELRRTHRISWAICTGRSMRSFTGIFLPLRSFGIAPDFVITSHAYIFGLTARGFAPHLLWNVEIKVLQWRHALLMRHAIPRLCRSVRSRHPFSRVVSMTEDRLCLRFEDPEFARAAAQTMRAAIRPYRYLRVFEYRNEIDVRAVPFTKGLALSELREHLGISPQHVLAVGDGHNDASMMDGSVARFVGCPLNAAPEVMEIVHKAGGHVASKRYLEGVMEILDAYATGNVRSALPESWLHPATIENPMHTRLPPRRSRGALRGALLFLAAIYTALLVFASFEALPFSEHLLRPWRALYQALQRIAPQLFQ